MLGPLRRSTLWLAALLLTAAVGNACCSRMDMSVGGGSIAPPMIYMGSAFGQFAFLGICLGLLGRRSIEDIVRGTLAAMFLATSMAVGVSLNSPITARTYLGLAVLSCNTVIVAALGGFALRVGGWTLTNIAGRRPGQRLALRSLFCYTALFAIFFAIWGWLARSLSSPASDPWSLGASLAMVAATAVTSVIAVTAVAPWMKLLLRPDDGGRWPTIEWLLICLCSLTIMVCFVIPNLVVQTFTIVASMMLTAWLASRVLRHSGWRITVADQDMAATSAAPTNRHSGRVLATLLAGLTACFVWDAANLSEGRSESARLSAYRRRGVSAVMIHESRVVQDEIRQLSRIGVVYDGKPWSEPARALIRKSRITMLHVRDASFTPEHLQLLAKQPLQTAVFDQGCFKEEFLPTLRNIPTLTRLQISKGNFNSPAMIKFRQERPDCAVLDPNAPPLTTANPAAKTP